MAGHRAVSFSAKKDATAVHVAELYFVLYILCVRVFFYFFRSSEAILIIKLVPVVTFAFQMIIIVGTFFI